MKTYVRSIGYVVTLYALIAAQTAAAGPLQAAAEEHGRQSVAAARELLQAELRVAMQRRSVAAPAAVEKAESAPRVAANRHAPALRQAGETARTQ
jgi:hypothetical protein